MTGSADGVLAVLSDALMKVLWSAIAVAAVLWLGMIVSLVRSAAHLMFCGRITQGRSPRTDAEFLRSMHIRP
jgi:hypothetical protein